MEYLKMKHIRNWTPKMRQSREIYFDKLLDQLTVPDIKKRLKALKQKENALLYRLGGGGQGRGSCKVRQKALRKRKLSDFKDLQILSDKEFAELKQIREERDKLKRKG